MAIENVLLITIDSLRYDYLDEFWCETEMDIQLASFDRAFATGPGTTPSFPGLLTGTLPLSYGGLGPLSTDRPRMARHLQRMGFQTGGFQCNPFLSSHFNYEMGFERFNDYQNPLMGVATKIFPRGIEINNPQLRQIDEYIHLTDLLKKSYRLIRGKPRPYVAADIITDDAIDWLKETTVPFFGWVHYMDVHHPCFPPEKYRVSFGVGDTTQAEVSETYSTFLSNPEQITRDQIEMLIGLYRSAIAFVRDQITRIFEMLSNTGRLEKTLVIITSDHGEMFGEHGQYGKPERMYDELLHVPLLIANAPDYLEDATDDLVSLLDLPPLIHNVLGLDVPETYEGRVSGVDDPREFVIAEHEVEGDVIIGARSQDWLYEGDEINNEHRLFDLRDGLKRAPIEDNAAASETVRRAVNERLEHLDIEARRLENEVEGDIEDRLEDLGYL